MTIRASEDKLSKGPMLAVSYHFSSWPEETIIVHISLRKCLIGPFCIPLKQERKCGRDTTLRLTTVRVTSFKEDNRVVSVGR